MLRDFLQARAGEALPKERRRELQRRSARADGAGRAHRGRGRALPRLPRLGRHGAPDRGARRRAARAGPRRNARALGGGAARRGADAASLDALLGGGEPGAAHAARGPPALREGVRAVPQRAATASAWCSPPRAPCSRSSTSSTTARCSTAGSRCSTKRTRAACRCLRPQVEARVACSMFISLTLRQPQRRDMKQWIERALAAAAGAGRRQPADVRRLCSPR